MIPFSDTAIELGTPADAADVYSKSVCHKSCGDDARDNGLVRRVISINHDVIQHAACSSIRSLMQHNATIKKMLCLV